MHPRTEPAAIENAAPELPLSLVVKHPHVISRSYASHADPGAGQLRSGARRGQRRAPVPERSARAADRPPDRDRRRLDPEAHRDPGAPLRPQRRHDGDQRPRAPRGPPRARRRGGRGRRDRLHHLRHAVARLPLPRHRRAAAEEARHRRAHELRVLRHPPAVLGLRLRPADGRRVHPHRDVPPRPPGRRRAPQPLARLLDPRARRHRAVRRRRRRLRARPDGVRRSARPA